MTKIILPKSGMGIEEGTIVRWLKSVGSKVERGEPVVEVETAKTTQEIAAPVSGVLIQILVAEGEIAAVNTGLAIIDESVQ